jgi:hypothetical protein
MLNTTTGLLLFGGFFVLLVLVAIFVVALVYLGRGQGKAKPSPEAASKATPAASSPPAALPRRQQAAEPAVTQAAGAEPAVTQLAAAPAADPDEVMRVIRDPQTGNLLVQVDGQRYAHIRQIHDAAVGRRVLSIVADLVQFTGRMAANPQAVRAASAEGDGRGRASSPVRAPGAAQTGDTPQRLSDLDALDAIEPAPPQPSYSVIGFFRRGFQAPPAESVPSSTAWIDEIDEILQRTIRALPTPPSQAVRVTSADDGMLQIMVGVRAYDSADQVPDPQIRGLIEAAVAEWEKS